MTRLLDAISRMRNHYSSNQYCTLGDNPPHGELVFVTIANILSPADAKGRK